MATLNPPQFLSPDEVAYFHREGYLVLRGQLPPDEVAAIRDAFMALAQDGPPEGLADKSWLDADEVLARWPRILQPHLHPELGVGPLSQRHLFDARRQAILRDLLGEEPVAVQSMFYFKPPGARGQDFHQDNFYLQVRPGTCVAAWLAIDDCDLENGGLCVVPGSQGMEIVCPESSDRTVSFTLEHVPIPDGLTTLPLELKAGDILFFNGSLIHGSQPNRSPDRFRRSFICHYVPHSTTGIAKWFRPLLTFDGTEITVETTPDGGPCGTPQSASGAH